MSKVFVINEPQPRSFTGWTPDIRTAETFGTIHYIFNKEDRPHRLPQGEVDERVISALLKFDPNEDHILWVGGDIIAFIIVVAYLTSNFTEFSLLQWQRNRTTEAGDTGHYAPLLVDLSYICEGPCHEA